MLGIVVLHETTVSLWENLSYKWDECSFQDVDVCYCIHYPIKDTNSCPSLQSDPCPHMDLHGVFGPVMRMKFTSQGKPLECYTCGSCR